MANTSDAITRIIDAYKSAVWARDADALMRLYDPNVRVFDTWGVWVYEGAEAWRRAVDAWFQSLGDKRVRVAFNDVQTTGSPDFASVSAIVSYVGVSPQNEDLPTMQNRISWFLKERGHVLRVVHEHTSAPVGFDDMKAILLKEPGRSAS